MRYLITFFLCLTFITPATALESYADLVETLMPSVVNISTERDIIPQQDDIDNVMIAPDLEGREALGSGFIIRHDGYILTNAHVINGAKKISVITNDEKKYLATIIGIDKPSDLAVLKITQPQDNNTVQDDFPAVKFGNADKARIGDIVLTFGNPYGLGVSVSQGIISAKSRKIGLNEQPYIQTDAAINQGNSGGPMFDLNGDVIGVNSAIFTTKGANGVGFSLPSNIANWVSLQLIEHGKVRRGWLGMEFAIGIDKYTEKAGFIITEIDENSNAYREGLRVGDIIISYNDQNADNLDSFKHYTETMEPNQALRLTIISLGEKIRTVVRIQEMPLEALSHITNKALTENNKFYHENSDTDVFYISELGIAVKEANPRGLSIVKLEKTSPFYGKGINQGDILLEADRTDIFTAENLLENIHNAIADDFRPITFFVQGTDSTFYSTIELEREDD